MLQPLLELGFDNFVFPKNVTVILNPNSAPAGRLIKEAKSIDRCFDVKQGRKVRGIVVLKTGEIVLSTKDTKTIRKRYMSYVDKVNKVQDQKTLDPLLDIGYGNFVFPTEVSIILNPETQPAVRLIKEAKANNKCYDIRQGNRASSCIVLNSGEIILSFLSTKTLQRRYLKYINTFNGLSNADEIIEEDKE